MFTYDVRPADPLLSRAWEDEARLSDLEFAGRTAARAFETRTLPGLALTDMAITAAEKAEGTYDPLAWSGAEEQGLGLAPSHRYALTEEEWVESPHYDKRVAYTPNMTPTRARLLKENLTRRDEEDRVLAREGRGAYRGALGFGAAMLASLPDPVNLVPFGSGARAASLGAAARSAAVAGTAGAVLSDAVTLPLARSWGEDVGFVDLAMDAVFGAVLGAGLGAAGHGLAKFLGARSGAHAPLAEGDLEARGGGDGYKDRAATGGPGPQGRSEGGFADRSDGYMERLRAELLGRERVKTGELADRVLADLDADAPLDVMRHARELGMDAPPFMPDGRPAVRTADLVETGARPFWGGLTADAVAPLAERFWRETLAALPPIEAQGGRTVVIRGGSGGWGKIRGKALDADKLKLLPYIDRILAEAEWVFTENARRAVHAENGVVLHDLLAAVEYDGRMLEVRLKVREDQNGKFFYDFFNESEGIPRGKKDAPPDARSDADAGGTRGGADSEQWGLRAASRREASPADTPNRDSSMPDAAGEVNSGYSPLERETVNLEVRDVTPDWTPQPAQRRGDAPLAEEGLAQEAARERALAFEAERLAQEGRITPEERAAFEETDAALGEIERESEAALAVLSCITGA